MTNADLLLSPVQRAAKQRLRKSANSLAKGIRLGRGPEGYLATDDYADCPECHAPGLRMFVRESDAGGTLCCVRCVVVDLDARGLAIQ